MDQLPRLDKNAITVTSLDDIEEEKRFWLSKNPLERLEAIELNRRLVYGKDRTASRLQRILETAQLLSPADEPRDSQVLAGGSSRQN